MRAVGLAAAVFLVAGAVAPQQPRPFQMLVALALLAGLATIGDAIARRLLGATSRRERALAAFTAGVAANLMVTTVLGHLGLLRPPIYLTVVAASTAVAALAPWRRLRGIAARRPNDADTQRELADDASAPAPAPDAVRVERWAAILAIAAVVALVVAYASQACRDFVAPLHPGPDDFSYHLTSMAVWMRWGDLRMVKMPMGDWSTAFYPLLPELSGWSLLAPFRDSDVLARWVELPFALASLVATAALARRLGLRRSEAALAVVLYGSMRRFVALAFAAGNDHVTGFAVLAALEATLGCVAQPRRRRFAYAGICYGLLVGSKYVGVYYALDALAVLAVGVFVAFATNRQDEARNAAPPRRWLAGLALLLAVAAIVGGYGYLRNLVVTGNPFYPQTVRLGPWHLPGVAEMSLAARRNGEFWRIDVPSFLAGPENLFGDFFRFLMLPACIVAPLWALLRRRWLAAAVLLVPAVAFLQFVELTPDHRDIRYLFGPLGVAAVAGVWLVARVAARWRWVTAALALALLAQAAGLAGAATAAEIGIAIAALAVAWAWMRRVVSSPNDDGDVAGAPLARVRVLAPLLAGVAAVAVALLAGSRVEAYQRPESKLARLPAALALERLTQGAPVRVAYAGANEPYPFFGARLQNDVRIVTRSYNREGEFYRWGGDPGWPYRSAHFRRWRDNVVGLHVRYLVIVRGPHEDPERRWAAQRSQEFRRVYWTDEVEIYRVTAHHGHWHRDPEA